jgi:hypothetical protein
VAGALNRDQAAQFAPGPFAIRQEAGILPQLPDDPRRGCLAGRQVAREVHAADHALSCELGGARQQLRPPRGHHVRQ